MQTDARWSQDQGLRPGDPDFVIRCPDCGRESAAWPIEQSKGEPVGPAWIEDSVGDRGTIHYVCPHCKFRLDSRELPNVYWFERSKSLIWRLIDRGIPVIDREWWDRLIKGRTGLTYNKLLLIGAILVLAGAGLVGTSVFEPDALRDERASSTVRGLAGVVAIAGGMLCAYRSIPKVLDGEGRKRPRAKY